MSKKVRELEQELYDKTRALENLKNQYTHLQMSLDYIREELRTIPEGCRPGDYCEACAFSKAVSVRIYSDPGNPRSSYTETAYVCCKDRCENFVPKKGIE